MAESKSRKTDEKPETPREAVQQTDPPESATSFPVERLISETGFLPKHPPHVIAGALAGVSRKNLTLAEAEAAVDTWLKSKVEEPKEA